MSADKIVLMPDRANQIRKSWPIIKNTIKKRLKDDKFPKKYIEALPDLQEENLPQFTSEKHPFIQIADLFARVTFMDLKWEFGQKAMFKKSSAPEQKHTLIYKDFMQWLRSKLRIEFEPTDLLKTKKDAIVNFWQFKSVNTPTQQEQEHTSQQKHTVRQQEIPLNAEVKTATKKVQPISGLSPGF